jgi:acetylornithine/N-succinyldiaminopimelate aminotransferase
VWLWDDKGKQYFDAVGGMAVNILGHAHPRIIQAIQEQATKLIHCSNLYESSKQSALAEVLCTISALDKAFFCNSGAEAVEMALKLARLYGHQKGFECPKILVTDHAYHGRTLACISAGGNFKNQKGFEPLLPGFVRVPFNDIPAIQAAAKAHPDIAAILIEPIQGERGIIVPADDYLSTIRKICDEHQWLMMLDEVQTGLGRTGTFFRYQAEGIKPDVLSIAKGLANGVPIGACLAALPYADLFEPGSHGSTFGGNHLSCNTALATLAVIEEEQLVHHAHKQGALLIQSLRDALKNNPHIVAIRGKGLMIGIELDKPYTNLMLEGLKQGILFSVSHQTTIRLLPSLRITEADIRELVQRLCLVITSLPIKHA